MDTFDGSKPNLISSKTLEDIESKLDIIGIDEGNRVLNGLGSFYENYILPNMFPLIVIALLILYLTIKYILKKDREEREEEDEEKNIKRYRVKKQMVTVDPDEILRNHDKKIIKKEAGISDMISDDYLLTDDESDASADERDENDDDADKIDDREKIQARNSKDQGPVMPNGMLDDEIMGLSQYDTGAMLQNRDTVYNMDKATALVFGKG